MAESNNPAVDQRSGYCAETKTFHNLRPRVPLPAPSQPLSITDYVFHLRHSLPSTSPFLIDSSSGHVITSPAFIRRTRSLAASLLCSFPSLTKNDVALIVSPPSLQIPVLYFSLLSIGVTLCPVNPLATPSELTHMVQLAKPAVAFTTSQLSPNLPHFKLGTVLVDGPEFETMMSSVRKPGRVVRVDQSDRAAILFSSGTTGRVKGVDLRHRNFIALIAGLYHVRSKASVEEQERGDVSLLQLPLFHVFGLTTVLRSASTGETLVMMTARVEFEGMLKVVDRFRVTCLPVSPPLVWGLAKSPVVAKYDLSSIQLIVCGGAPLGKYVLEAFLARFPTVVVNQGYGLTETGGAATRMLEPEETTQYGSVGKLCENLEAKIVDPTSGEALPPNQRGELWLRGPVVMRGYVGDDEATAATLDPDGWLKTGDLCYFDSDGFLYVVDRLKELIKYKAYQVPPAELEHLLQGHPEISDAAVVPYPDEEAGQIPMAFIVRKPESSITAAQVMDFIAKQVSPYKKIRRVAFVNAIPKSPAGKILRRELANSAVSGVSSKL